VKLHTWGRISQPADQYVVKKRSRTWDGDSRFHSTGHLRSHGVQRLISVNIGFTATGVLMRRELLYFFASSLLVLPTSIAAYGQQTSAPISQNNAGAKGSPQIKHKIGIFGFGSLIADPGEELAADTIARVQAETPFSIEYDHSSTHTRSGAPTLVPVKTGGAKVKATIFVLKDSISEQEAANILYRRETRQIGSGKAYKPSAKPGPNTVLVATATNVMGVEKVLYTDFPDSGKLVSPTAQKLAELAIGSARSADVPDGMDGISYLMAAKKAGIITPLSADYEKEILKQSGTTSLEAALAKLRPAPAQKQN
jgi:hypothetical protein